MSDSQKPDNPFLALRRLAAEHPREARARIGQLLDERPPELYYLLTQIGSPGEGRLRHIVANLVCSKVDRAAAVPQLAHWLATETDEFTKKALRLAAKASGAVEAPMPASRGIRPASESAVEAYRYAASRLSHRVRNALIEPQTALLKLRRSAAALHDSTLQTPIMKQVEELAAGFLRVSRIVEFATDDRHFEMRPIVIHDWLISMNDDYGVRYSPIHLSIDASAGAATIRVFANEHLLSAIFWNLWINAHQAVRDACRVTVRIRDDDLSVRLTIFDNGDGFSLEAKEAAFIQAYSGYSGNGVNRGSGLLEVQDAVERLLGQVGLVEESGQHRVEILLPKADLS